MWINLLLCENDCHKGLLSKMKPYGFTVFAKRYGLETLLDGLERNEKNGVIYHREDYILQVFRKHPAPYV